MNEAMGTIRSDEAKQFPEFLRKTRFLFLKNPEKLSLEEKERLDTMVANQCHKSVEAYTHKLNLQNVYYAESRQEAEILLKQWHKKAAKSAIGLIQKMAMTVKDHWDGILNYFDSMLTTGFLEGINSLIQAAKARARGYRNTRNMISIAYLIAGKLKFNKLYAQPT